MAHPGAYRGNKRQNEIKRLEKLMMEHARNLEFEKAARVRDQLAILKEQAFGAAGSDNVQTLAADK